MQQDGLHQLRDVRVAERGQVGDELVEELTEVARVRACACSCACACACARVCMCVRAGVRIGVCWCVYVRLSVSMRVRACVRACVGRVRLCVCVCACAGRALVRCVDRAHRSTTSAAIGLGTNAPLAAVPEPDGIYDIYIYIYISTNINHIYGAGT
jgi:hypothetical protein